MKKRSSEKDQGINVEIVQSTKGRDSKKEEKKDLMTLFDNINPTKDINSSLAQINVSGSNEEKDIIDDD